MLDLAFDLPPRRAIAAVSPEARTPWRTHYYMGEGTKLRAPALLDQTERELRGAGAETTIHAVWVTLVVSIR